VFVYGTLRAGASHGGMLDAFKRHDARVRGRLYDLPEGYPAIVPVEADEWVYGELVDGVPDRVLGLLDHYEGVEEGLYQRVVVEAWLGLRPVPAWAWVMDQPERRGGVRVPSGRWRPSRKR
jgi:gamma-glutamylcyclotransferase (GGCT)/AIG2-like uncharacterized protein YtfP